MRLVHVLGLGWSGSSAIFEDLRGLPDVVGLTDGGDGETCLLCKRVNPRDFQRFFPDQRLTALDVLHLLTGGRLLGFGANGRWEPSASQEPLERDHGVPKPDVVAHIQRHRKYGKANQHFLPELDPAAFLTIYASAVPSDDEPFTNAGTRRLLVALLHEHAPGARFAILNNDPSLSTITPEDLSSTDVFIIVTRRARSQLADRIDQQMIAKELRLPTPGFMTEWVRDQLTYRWRTRRLIRQAQAGRIGARVATIRFEDYVVLARVRAELRASLGLDASIGATIDLDRSANNIRVEASLRIPLLVRLACGVLDLIRPRTDLSGLRTT